jgi:tRNA uridine 5-carboxymethylaminomethyl modification enzyme
VDDTRWAQFCHKQEVIAAEKSRLAGILLRPQQLGEAENALLGGPLGRETTALDLLRRPGVDYAGLHRLPGLGAPHAHGEATAQLEIDIKYDGYLERQRAEIERQRHHETTPLAADLDYFAIRGLSHEVRQKLAAARPATLGQASRVPGVTPAAISLLLVHLKRSRGNVDAA